MGGWAKALLTEDEGGDFFKGTTEETQPVNVNKIKYKNIRIRIFGLSSPSIPIFSKD